VISDSSASVPCLSLKERKKKRKKEDRRYIRKELVRKQKDKKK
jgi:menaquinone-dependent protoporphyrinogen IX oxidase